MKYQGFTTFTAEQDEGVLTVIFNFGSVNVQGQEMLADLNSLAMRLERDRKTKVVVFQSANPGIWVCHYDTGLLKDLSTEAVSPKDAQLLDLHAVCERISRVPRATSKTPAIKRFSFAEEKGLEHDIENQRNWNDLVMAVQEIH